MPPGGALKKGLPVRLTLSEAARVSGTLSIDGRRGGQLGLAAAPIMVAGATRTTLQVAATGAAGNQSRTSARKLTLKG